MVNAMLTFNSTTPSADFSVLVESNLSISAERLLLLFLALSLCTLLIALGLTLIGYWPVLVFALFHLGLVGWAWWHAWRSHWIKEWIRLDPQQLQVIHVDHRGQRRWQQDSRWTRVVWTETNAAGTPPQRLLLRAGGEETEVGAFLNDNEKRELAHALKQALATITA